MPDSPGDDNLIDTLNAGRLSVVLAGPGTFRLVRGVISQYGVSVGAYSET